MNAIVYKKYDKKFTKIDVIRDSWKNKTRMWGDRTHRISSYIAMFTPSLANFFIEKYTKPGDIILDTFSGRGTTILEARLMGRKGFAIDLNPYAYVLSKSKSKSFEISSISERIDELENEFNKIDKKNLSWENDMEIYYSTHNLFQIVFLKNKLGLNWSANSDIDNYILSLLLGIMHGPSRKNGDSIYLSLSMSNHTAMSKNYVRKYAKEHKLKKPESNVFAKLRDRAEWILKKSKYTNVNAEVRYGNALESDKIFKNIVPRLILSSPPYLNIINYTTQNWIKMWLLGFDNKEDNLMINLDDKHNYVEYKNFMIKYLNSISNMISINSYIALVIGDIVKKDACYSFDDIWDEIKAEVTDLFLSEVYIDNIDQNKKATNSMGKKAGKATIVEKIYVFKKNKKAKAS